MPQTSYFEGDLRPTAGCYLEPGPSVHPGTVLRFEDHTWRWDPSGSRPDAPCQAVAGGEEQADTMPATTRTLSC